MAGLPNPLQVLVSLMISIPIMIWVVLPQLTRLFCRWLYPGHKPRLTRTGSEP